MKPKTISDLINYRDNEMRLLTEKQNYINTFQVVFRGHLLTWIDGVELPSWYNEMEEAHAVPKEA